jgi:hypothetical protein
VARAISRKHRGYETQRLIAKRWKANGLAPYAVPVGAGDHGEDILNSPEGLVVEIKARDTVTLPKALEQASKSDPNAIPLVIWRHNGQGEASLNNWTVTITLKDFETLYLAWRNAENG